MWGERQDFEVNKPAKGNGHLINYCIPERTRSKAKRDILKRKKNDISPLFLPELDIKLAKF